MPLKVLQSKGNYTLYKVTGYPISEKRWMIRENNYEWLQSPGDEPTVVCKYRKKIYYLSWYSLNVLHRDGGLPADIIITNFTIDYIGHTLHGEIRHWYNYGDEHNCFGPSFIFIYKNNVMLMQYSICDNRIL